MKFPDDILIQHILNECVKIQNILDKITYEEYLEETMYQDALIRPLEVIGEAAGNISQKFAEEHPSVPVSNMKGILNLLMHQYFRVDLNLVWQTCINDIPTIHAYLNALKK